MFKRYPDGRREITVLDDVSLEVDEGDFVGIWGVRRSGKSTLLQIASGKEPPDEGAVRFDGNDVTRMSPDRRAKLLRHGGIGLLSVDWSPERNKPVIEHVALPLLSDGMSLREAREPAWRALELVGIASCAYMPADRVSHGERVRVALAQTLVHGPRLLLVDEPAVPLKPERRSRALRAAALTRPRLGAGNRDRLRRHRADSQGAADVLDRRGQPALDGPPGDAGPVSRAHACQAALAVMSGLQLRNVVKHYHSGR